MKVIFPNYTNKSPYLIHQLMATYSKTICLRSFGQSVSSGSPLLGGRRPDESEYVYEHFVKFDPREGSQNYGKSAADFSLSITDEKDFLAFESLFRELVRLKPLIEEGQYTGPDEFKISSKGKTFAFEMLVNTTTYRFTPLAEDGSFEKCDVVQRRPSANQINVYVPNGRKRIYIGTITLYSSLQSALYVAHDLAVIRAMIEGVSEDAILAMKPLKTLNPFNPLNVAKYIAESPIDHEYIDEQSKQLDSELLSLIRRRESLAPEETSNHNAIKEEHRLYE